MPALARVGAEPQTAAALRRLPYPKLRGTRDARRRLPRAGRDVGFTGLPVRCGPTGRSLRPMGRPLPTPRDRPGEAEMRDNEADRPLTLLPRIPMTTKPVWVERLG